ncbi:unnamed protein product, partial [Rotaria magnacalcarata]
MNTIFDIVQAAISYNENLDSSCYGKDINYADRGLANWATEEHLKRVNTMMQALTHPNSSVRNEPRLAIGTHCALNVWLVRDWLNPNWWFNQIGIPLLVTGQLLMLGDNVTNFEVQKITEISFRSDWWEHDPGTGANLIWMLQIELYRSLATNNRTGIEQVHRRANSTTAIKMQSIRTQPTECINDENQQGEHLSQAVLNIYTTSATDYREIFLLLDWNPSMESLWNMIFQLNLNNAWTTLASRLLTTAKASDNVQWVHIGNSDIDHVLQTQEFSSVLGAEISTKTASYNTIGPYNDTLTSRAVAIWLDHGLGPHTRNYSYIILPNVKVQSMPELIKRYNDDEIFSCISNQDLLHAMAWPTLQRVSIDYGQGCIVLSDFTTNVTVALPSSDQLLGASVTVT